MPDIFLLLVEETGPVGQIRDGLQIPSVNFLFVKGMLFQEINACSESSQKKV